MFTFFDKLEDWIRQHLSQHPFIYSFIGGIGIVLFWRGVWMTADLLSLNHPFLTLFFYPPLQILISVLVLLSTGILVSTFIGDRIIISGLRQEKKIEERTEELVKEEVITLRHIKNEIQTLREEITKNRS